MDEHIVFDGEAISRADREFLASLGDHPLLRHPLYSAPPPPLPDYTVPTILKQRAKHVLWRHSIGCW